MTFIFHPHYGPTFRERGRDKETRRLARKANQETRELQDDVLALQSQVDRLYLITEAMWFVMKDKLGLDDDKLGELVEEIDQRVASFEGTSPGPCSKCARPLSVRTGTCIYCGSLEDG